MVTSTRSRSALVGATTIESAYEVVDALIKADKDFDLVIIPGAGHGSDGAAH